MISNVVVVRCVVNVIHETLSLTLPIYLMYIYMQDTFACSLFVVLLYVSCQPKKKQNHRHVHMQPLIQDVYRELQ